MAKLAFFWTCHLTLGFTLGKTLRTSSISYLWAVVQDAAPKIKAAYKNAQKGGSPSLHLTQFLVETSEVRTNDEQQCTARISLALFLRNELRVCIVLGHCCDFLTSPRSIFLTSRKQNTCFSNICNAMKTKFCWLRIKMFKALDRGLTPCVCAVCVFKQC